jgi:glycosyltransferase involved in cell wall biosynthesis
MEARRPLATPAPASIWVVLPAYNAAKTIKDTLDSIPNREQYQFLLCDDGSRDNTVEVARAHGLEVIVHPENRGYGANQKTLYNTVLSRVKLTETELLPQAQHEARFQTTDIVVMFHPDNQYDGSVIPKMVELIEANKADFVLGNRMAGNMPQAAGMPLYKQLANKGLTELQSSVYGIKMGEFHTGLRAYSRKVLETVPFNTFSDDFVFDSEMIAAAITSDFKIKEVPVQARYFREASSINLSRSIKYGLETLKVLWRFKKGYYK